MSAAVKVCGLVPNLTGYDFSVWSKWESPLEADGQLVAHPGPVGNGHGPLFLDVHLGQIEQFAHRFGCREDRLVLGHLAQLAMVSFNGIVGIDQPANLAREVEEGREFSPVVFPGTNGGRIFVTPFLGQLEEVGFPFLPGLGLVDGPEILHELFLVGPGHVAQGVADLVDDAPLDNGLGIDGLDGVREPGEAIHTGDQDVFHAATLEVAQHTEPEIGAFATVADPVAQHILVAVRVHGQDDVDGHILDLALPPQFDVECIEKDDGINGGQGTILPLFHQRPHLVGDGADGRCGDFNSVDVGNRLLDSVRYTMNTQVFSIIEGADILKFDDGALTIHARTPLQASMFEHPGYRESIIRTVKYALGMDITLEIVADI